jgi:hypothetical protein
MKINFRLILLATLFNVSLAWFTIKGNQLIDANGKQFIPRGINAGGAYSFSKGVDVCKMMPAIAVTGANVVRVMWRDEDEMASENLQILTDPDLVKTITETIKNKMIPIIVLANTTQGYDNVTLNHAGDWWINKTQLLMPFKDYLLINLGNEWVSES